MKNTIIHFFMTFSILIVLLFIFLSCDEKQPTNLLQSKQDISTQDEEYFFDEETGQIYLLNPNWQKIENPVDLAKGLSSLGNYYDWSGQVEIGIWEATSYGQHNVSVACNVGADYICIGGGARVDNSDGVNGAPYFLKVAHPQMYLTQHG